MRTSFTVTLFLEAMATLLCWGGVFARACVHERRSEMTVWRHYSQGDAALKLHRRHLTAHRSVSTCQVPPCPVQAICLQIFLFLGTKKCFKPVS